MVSHEAVEPTPYDRNKAIAEAGERQSHASVMYELHSEYGLDPKGTLGLYAARDIRDAFERLIARYQNPTQNTQAPGSEQLALMPETDESTSLPDAQQ